MQCPNCGGEMAATKLEGRLGTSIEVDICHACQGFWFDSYESMQLAPGATLALFRIIGAEAGKARAPFIDTLRCPRCSRRLLQTHDRQRNTPFQYFRCAADNGRYIGFYDFLREKNFIRPLSAQQIAELRTNVRMVGCSNCGAPIDLVKSAECPACKSPLSMLDMQQAATLVSELQRASEPKAISPTLPMDLLLIRKQVENAMPLDHATDWSRDVVTDGLIGGSVSAFVRWLARSS